MTERLSVLLASAAFGGTLAAARDLDRKGFDVRIVAGHRLEAAVWSRHAARVHFAPSESESQRFLEHLLAIGAADPGQILLPTSDETAWLYVENAVKLQQHFRLYQPSIASLRRILDKKLFSDAAASAGLDVLPSWNPRTIDELVALAPNLPYPILIKPRTHVHRLQNNKGIVVSSESELIGQYQRFVNHEKVGAAFNPVLSQTSLPILQQFVRVGSEGVRSITGFIDRMGDSFVTRVATKVFQRSQPVGVGICFESRPSDPALSNAVCRLCRELGYFGVFEVEFVRFEDRWAAIDFNPRLFNQIGMDVRRGMPLPLFACLDAAGEAASLREAVAKAQAEQDEETVFYDRFTLNAILLAQALTARISSEDRTYWRAWMKQHAAHAVDVAADISDPVPGVIHALSEIYLGLRSFPRFMLKAARLAFGTSSSQRGAVVNRVSVAIVGAGPYGLSLAAHLAAYNIEHRIFGRPMQFWSHVANAGGDRYLRTYCFGTNISTPRSGFSFVDYSKPRGLETVEPCSISDFVCYGHWFQQAIIPWVEPIDVMHIAGRPRDFTLTLADGQRVLADRVIIATGLSCFAYVPPAIASLSPALAAHTSEITSFMEFKGRDVAVIGAGQSALEAAALLREAGARPQLIIREHSMHWMSRVPVSRSIWRRLRSPISPLGSGPTAWMLANLPGAIYHFPDSWRSRFVNTHLAPGGAWWLRDRVENRMPVHLGTTVEAGNEAEGRVALRLRVANDGRERQLIVDHVIAGTGYDIDVDRLVFLDPALRVAIRRLGRAPRLNATFETSVPGLGIIGPASAMSFGPLFRFVAGSEYAAQVVSASLVPLSARQNPALQIVSKTRKA